MEGDIEGFHSGELAYFLYVSLQILANYHGSFVSVKKTKWQS